jgi:CRISPR-associated endonuclease/helicase Cas3
MEDKRFYAHSKEGRTEEEWQLLEEHLKNVADLACLFARAFDSGDWAYLGGLWHDLGKYQAEFQDKLFGKKTAVEHSGAGAAFAFQVNKDLGLPLSFIIAAHHAGLPNLKRSDPDQPVPLHDRIINNHYLLERITHQIPDAILHHKLPVLPPHLSTIPTAGTKAFLSRNMEFWIRFLFSALVDADRLDSEEVADPKQKKRRYFYDSIEELLQRVDKFMDLKIQNLKEDEKKLEINKKRFQILQDCKQAAEMPPGFFALTVPTGGGKTLAGLSFALRHASEYDLCRVIVVIPYTSIIEQNASVYRQAIGAESVVEHHSNLDPLKKIEILGEEITQRHDLAVENWDAPVIVTTTVQFFESLFSNLPSRCRKLHNIAKSVIILDEVQTLPPSYLLSIVEALNELVLNYHCSVVLSTATPPALAARQHFEMGLKDIRPIIADSNALFSTLKRVEYAWPSIDDTPKEWDRLADELSQYRQVLAVVHRRNDTKELALHLKQQLPDPETVFHLSALMCPAHRLHVLEQIRDRLNQGQPCRVVSTQLVEAGVDVDFPIVYRALGGLDSIIQAGGRCNREGRLTMGKVIIFKSPTYPPSGTPKKALACMESLIKEKNGNPDPYDLGLIDRYFRMLYMIEDLDANHVQSLRQEFNFASVAQNFQLIEDGFTRSIIVPYSDAEKRVQTLKEQGPNRDIFRSLQPFIVNVYTNGFDRLYRMGALEQISEGIFYLSPICSHLYDESLGLLMDEDSAIDPRKLIFDQ